MAAINNDDNPKKVINYFSVIKVNSSYLKKRKSFIKINVVPNKMKDLVHELKKVYIALFYKDRVLS